MNCSISGEVPEEPVVSKSSGLLFEKRLIERHISVRVQRVASVASSSNSAPDPTLTIQDKQQPHQHLQEEITMPVKIESAAEDVSSQMLDTKTESQQHISNGPKTEVLDSSLEKSTVTNEEQVEKFKKDQIEKFKEDQCEKLKKYEADYKQYLISKYFSDKTIFGGNIFDVKMNADGGTIRSSRLPVYQSYLDPVTFHSLLDGKESVSPAETAAVAVNLNGKSSSTQGIGHDN